MELENEIRRSYRSLSNRVGSILEDTQFVQCVAETYAKPLIPNKRCGLWYVPPNARAGEAYFKSTDGHINQWDFSLKRMNLHLIPILTRSGAIIIVDSTRRGKKMPDAFSKTVPIWCAVLNIALLGVDPCDAAYFPSGVVSASEIDQIIAKLPSWAAKFTETTPKHLLPHISKPIRPVWVNADAPLPYESFGVDAPVLPDALAVVLCTASKQAQDGEIQLSSGGVYIQGAADDHELWAPAGFEPNLFWREDSQELREHGISDSELQRRVELALKKHSEIKNSTLTEVAVGPLISVAHVDALARVSPLSNTFIVDLHSSESGHFLPGESIHAWQVAGGKRGARQLKEVLPQICDAFEHATESASLIVSDSSTDIAEAVALMLASRYFASDGSRLATPNMRVSKSDVTRANVQIIAASGVVPSRTVLNIVGSFLRN